MKQYEIKDDENIIKYESNWYLDSFKDSDFITEILQKEGLLNFETFSNKDVYKTNPPETKKVPIPEKLFKSETNGSQD